MGVRQQRVLVTNDDGIDALGLGALCDAFRGHAEVWTVAPMVQQSACSHSLSLHRALRVQERGERRFAVDGTPADCVYLALHHLLPESPDIVLSGINHGANVGLDVLYSGTVAGATEACVHGFPALAVSLEPASSEPNWSTAGVLATRVVEDLLARGLPPGIVLNLNVPDMPLSEIRGVRTCSLGIRHYTDSVDVRNDPRGRPYYWIGGQHSRFEDLPETDGPIMSSGFATLTPLRCDRTAEDVLTHLSDFSSVTTER